MLRGATGLDLLQRMSTNNLADIAEGEIRPTVLTTAIGRIVDRVLVLSLGDRWMVMTSPGRGDTVLSWLRRHVFFQDDVSLEPATAFAQHWFIMGHGRVMTSGAAWRRTPLRLPVGGAPSPRASCGRRCRRNPPACISCSSRPPPTIPASGIGAVEATVAEEAYQALRIEAGFPEFGREFNDDDIPLEVGLTYAVSFSKGCYLGQEIIARMESRARTWQTVGARLPPRNPDPFRFPPRPADERSRFAAPGMDRPCRRPPRQPSTSRCCRWNSDRVARTPIPSRLVVLPPPGGRGRGRSSPPPLPPDPSPLSPQSAGAEVLYSKTCSKAHVRATGLVADAPSAQGGLLAAWPKDYGSARVHNSCAAAVASPVQNPASTAAHLHCTCGAPQVQVYEGGGAGG